MKEKRNGDLKHVPKVRDDQPGRTHSLDLVLADAATGTTLLAAKDELAVDRERHYVDELCFDGDPTGAAYEATVTLTSAEETLAFETAVTIPAVGAGTFDAEGGRSEGLRGGLVVEATGDGCVLVGVRAAGASLGDVSGVEVQFNEPFDGPEPISNPLRPAFESEWTRYVHTAPVPDGLTVGQVDVELDLYDDEDTLEDSETHRSDTTGSVRFRCPDVLFKPSFIGID